MDFDISKMVYVLMNGKLKNTQYSHIKNNIFKKKYLKSILSNTQYKLKKIIIFVNAKVSETDPK